MGNQKGVQQEQNVCRGPAGDKVNISVEMQDLEWSKTPDAGMGPKQEVVQENRKLHLTACPIQPARARPLASTHPVPSPLSHPGLILPSASYTLKAHPPREAFCKSLGVRLGLSKPFNFNRPPFYTHTCLSVKREKYLLLRLY